MSSSNPVESLRGVSLRVTKQRTAVLRVLKRHPHADAGSVARAVRKEIGAVSTQAVYDVLAVLGSAGLVRKIEPAGLPALFELSTDDNHHHAVCRTCGAVADVGCAVGDQPCLAPPSTGNFVVDEAEVIYWGLCSSCKPATDELRAN